MSIRKIKGLESDFTIVPNKSINDKLSWAARGMLLYLCSKPEDWDVCITDLVRQTTGSKKRSGRDAVRSIMDELIECGYMRKSQDRNIKGQFKNSDHEVSFTPFTENPYTVQATQESKELTKERLNKPLRIDKSNTNIFPKDLKDNSSRKFIDQLNQSHYPLCNIAMEELEYLKNDYQNIYLGSQQESTWIDCESILRDICNTDEAMGMSSEEAVSRFVRVTYLTRCINNKNKVGLPFMIGLVAKIGADSAVNPDHVDLLSDEF